MIKPVAPSPATLFDPKLRKAAQGFEAVFLREIIGSMRKGKLADEMFGSSATDNFREMADARTAESMAKLGHFGIAAMVEKGLSNDVKSGGHSSNQFVIASEARQSRVAQRDSGLLRSARNDSSEAIT
jgi:peptidoglycan hydrolase FlgJ